MRVNDVLSQARILTATRVYIHSGNYAWRDFITDVQGRFTTACQMSELCHAYSVKNFLAARYLGLRFLGLADASVPTLDAISVDLRSPEQALQADLQYDKAHEDGDRDGRYEG